MQGFAMELLGRNLPWQLAVLPRYLLHIFSAYVRQRLRFRQT
jgi:hypothetical protein